MIIRTPARGRRKYQSMYYVIKGKNVLNLGFQMLASIRSFYTRFSIVTRDHGTPCVRVAFLPIYTGVVLLACTSLIKISRVRVIIGS